MAVKGAKSKHATVGRVRPLVAEDLDAVVALDARISGRSRLGYFERRLAAALRHPERHIQVAISEDGDLLGFVLARVVGGEFGEDRSAAMLEAIGVVPERRRQGIGAMLCAGLEAVMRRKGIAELRTQAEWTNHDLLRFLDASGFHLAPRQVVARPVAGALEI